MIRSFIIFLMLSPIDVFGQQLSTFINTVRYLEDSPNGTDITSRLQTLIRNSGNNDIIVIPPGKFIINGQIDIYNKQISFVGYGSDSTRGTMLYRKEVDSDYSSMFNFIDITSISPVVVSGIYFKSLKNRNTQNQGNDNCLEFNRVKNFIVSDNVFQYFGFSSITVRQLNSIIDFNNLIFNNQFLNSYIREVESLGYGIAVYIEKNFDNSWSADPEFGSKKFLFIENNYFKETRHAVAGGSNSRYVFRYNKIEDNWVSHSIDMHGAGEYNNNYSARAAEIYSNTVTTKYDLGGELITEKTPWNSFGPAIGIRGGEALIYNNKISNHRNAAVFSLEEKNPLGYPSPYQIGYMSGLKYGRYDLEFAGDHGEGDVFAWDNAFVRKYPEWKVYIIPIADTSYIKFDRDVHIDIKKTGYVPYLYPSGYRNSYYSMADKFLSMVSNLVLTNLTSSTVSLIWNNVLFEDGYYIYESNDGVNFTLIDSTDINDTTRVISGLDPEQQTYFYIRAFNDDRIGLKSEIVSTKQQQRSIVTLYPNPSTGLFNISFKESFSSDLMLYILNFKGNIVYEEDFGPNISGIFKRIDFSNKAPGLYHIVLIIGESIYNLSLLLI